MLNFGAVNGTRICSPQSGNRRSLIGMKRPPVRPCELTWAVYFELFGRDWVENVTKLHSPSSDCPCLILDYSDSMRLSSIAARLQ